MKTRPNTIDYEQLFLSGAPLMDVRAPVEFNNGAFPAALNLPLMNDQERHDVGIEYKEKGQDAAIVLGNALVSGELKHSRINRWKDFVSENPNGYLYCFRGGLRSRTVQDWLKDEGINYPLVTGGYKAMRRFLIDETERLVSARDFHVIGGRTGSGKTLLLPHLSGSIDLEGLANHRGSSFGRSVNDYQPSQIDFENAFAVDLMKACSHRAGPICVEDESRCIGRLNLPESLYKKMGHSSLVIVEESDEERVNVILKDYVTDMKQLHEHEYGEEGFDRFSDFLLSSLERIQKRLGGERYQALKSMMENALSVQLSTGDENQHRLWITALLHDYYDPMYDYQLSKKAQPILFKGSRKDIIEWYISRPCA